MSDYAVHLTTNNPQAEVLLINSRFKVVARGASPLTAKVPQGLYSMKVRIGSEEREELFAIRGVEVPANNAPFTKHLNPPEFSSAIPLHDTSTTHEYHEAAARKYLGPNAPTIQRGAGGTIVLCVRDSSNDPIEDRERYSRSFRGFRLLDAQGTMLVDFDNEAEHSIDDRFMAARVDVDPGSYVLACESGDASICLPLPTPFAPPPGQPRWILQAYLSIVAGTKRSVEVRPDLSDVSIVFSRDYEGFQPSRLDWQIMETVRKGLLEGRNYVKTAAMEELLTRKFENPMLGLYGAHLLLLESTADNELLETVITNCANLLGDSYPDVVALAWTHMSRTGRLMPAPYPAIKDLIGRVTGPPLLSRSWEPLVEAVRQTDPSCATSPVMRVAANLVASRLFLSWEGKSASLATAASAPKPTLVPEMAPRAAQAPSPYGGLLAIGLTLVNEFFKGIRRVVGTREHPLPVASIEAISNATEAAAVLKWIAQSYDWGRILPELKRQPNSTNNLTGLQRDLLLIMRSTANDKDALEAITPTFVDKLLEAYRVPLPTLVQSLSGLESGGYWSTALQNLLEASKQAKEHSGASIA